MRIKPLDQRSAAWHAWRQGIIGGSDAPVIMGDSKWSTPHKLWEQKTGRRPAVPDNPAMARGRALEEEALRQWEKYTGESASPVCVEHEELDFVGASLDGMSFDGQLIVEIKCPGISSHEEVVKTGQVPAHYWAQVQHQLACVQEAEVLHFWSYHPEHEVPGYLVVVERDEAYIGRLLKTEAAFWECVRNDIPPAGEAFLQVERLYVSTLEEQQEVLDRLQALKDDLIALVPPESKRVEGRYLTAALVEKKGALDYKALLGYLIAQLQGMNLPPEAQQLLDEIPQKEEAFRKKGSIYWDIRRKKGGEE